MIDGCRKAVEHCKAKGVDIVELAIEYSCSHSGIATTLVGTARPKNILDNIAYLEKPMDEGLLSEVLEILKPVQNFKLQPRTPLEHHDPFLGS